MGKITKRQTLTVLRKLQKFQAEDCGKHNISITSYTNEKGRLWLAYNAIVCGEFFYGNCYEWREYEENLEMVENFIKTVRNNG